MGFLVVWGICLGLAYGYFTPVLMDILEISVFWAAAIVCLAGAFAGWIALKFIERRKKREAGYRN